VEENNIKLVAPLGIYPMSSSPVFTEKNINLAWPMRSSLISFLWTCMEKTNFKRKNDHGISAVLSSLMIMEEASIKDFVSKRYSTVRPWTIITAKCSVNEVSINFDGWRQNLCILSRELPLCR